VVYLGQGYWWAGYLWYRRWWRTVLCHWWEQWIWWRWTL